MNKIYFDNAATTQIDPSVIELMNGVMSNHYGNPNSTHSFGRSTRTLIEKARKSISKEFNVLPAEIFFTSCGTESDNLVLISAVRDLGVKRIITSKIEHKAVLNVVKFLELNDRINVEYVKVKVNGLIDYDDLDQVLNTNKQKTLVSLMHVNNEIGSLLDLTTVGDICKKHDAFFHSDTVQSIGKYKFDLSKLNIDFIVGSAHKFHGPKGVGILYINARNKLNPFIHGGGQERNMRAGTENIYGIVGFAKALEIAVKNHEVDHAQIASLKSYLKTSLEKNIKGVVFNGDPSEDSLYTVLNVGFPRTEKSEMLLFNMDIRNICVSGGSACSSGAIQGSHVINALQLPDQSTVRFSFSKYNTRQEIDAVIEALKELI